MKEDKYARTMRTVDLTTAYTGIEAYKNMGLYFGIYLVDAATVKVDNMDGATETLVLGAGYHPGQFTKIYANGDGTNVASVIIFY